MKQTYTYVVFGASGTSGKYISKELSKRKDEKNKWAVAGRNKEKIIASLKEMEVHPLPPIIVVDVADKEGLTKLCKSTKILINCVGPYNLYGDDLVSICIENKTHYLDLAEEKVFLERIKENYHKKAEENSVFVLQPCGTETVASEISTILLENMTKRREAPSKITHINNFYFFESAKLRTLNYTTYKTFIIDASTRNNLKNDPYKNISLFKKIRMLIPEWNENHNCWMCLFPLECSRFINQRSQNARDVPKGSLFDVDEFIMVEGFFEMFFMTVSILLFILASRIKILRENVLMKYPQYCAGSMFNDNAPSREETDSSGFKMVAEAKISRLSINKQRKIGTSDKISLTVSGPEPGYTSSAICTLACAKMLSEDRDYGYNGGVMTPGTLFRTYVNDFADELEKNDIFIK